MGDPYFKEDGAITAMSGPKGEESTSHQIELLLCCRHLIQQFGHEASERFSSISADSGSNGRKITLERIIQTARGLGLQTVIHRPEFEQLFACLPAVAEFRNGRYVLVSEWTHDSETALTLLFPQSPDNTNLEKISLQKFQEIWAGGILYFRRVNTALLCFSIVAREHQIEVSPERLAHEYAQPQEMVGHSTMLRMAKDNGLRAHLFHLDWEGLLKLNKAFPVIARLHSGQYVVLAGVTRSPEEGEARLVCFDPLLGSGKGMQHLSPKQYETISTGDVFVFKRVFELSDENQPFGLRWWGQRSTFHPKSSA
nr:cysteine peptidase family C39 domain-containing protein [uncultured Desulfobulbus sp.]